MNRDQIDGRVMQGSGTVKQFVGRVLGKRALEFEGSAQQAIGRAQAGYGDLRNERRKRNGSAGRQVSST